MQKTQINSEIAQAMFESAANAADKGQSQFFTPIEFGRAVAGALPRIRPVITDLNCGGGHLLQASAAKDTHTLLGSDIDPCRKTHYEDGGLKSENGRKAESLFSTLDPSSSVPSRAVTRIAYDLTKLYPLLVEVDWIADLFVLNPPWRLYWYRDRLESLAKSKHPTVRQAFAGIEDGLPKGTIDSTIATLLIALDRCSVYGEGLLIANNNTLDRLIFREGAPHAAIARHIWARAVIPGNPMTGIENCNFVQTAQDPPFSTAILYFAIGHTTGCHGTVSGLDGVSAASRIGRHGSELRLGQLANHNCVELWSAVRERVKELEGARPKVPWNLWLDNGVIRTALSSFEQHSTRINKAETARLHNLNGKKPMQCVLQRADRKELLQICDEGGWKVQPDLRAAIELAINEYHGARAPLYPLPEIQRLGYLDEQDEIECKLDLMLKTQDSRPSTLLFRSGHKYPIRTQTVGITRTVSKPNPFTGELEKLEYTGQELAIYLSTEDEEFCFMDAKLKNDGNTRIPNTKRTPDSKPRTQELRLSVEPVDFTLQELCRHFVIPDVPDVATVNPKGYEENVNLLTQLEELMDSIPIFPEEPAARVPIATRSAGRAFPRVPAPAPRAQSKIEPAQVTQRFNPAAAAINP